MTRTIARLATALIALLALALPAAAQQPSATITIDLPWARATVGAARQSAVYMIVRNVGPAADRLLAASTPLAEKVELHTVIAEGTVMRMRPIRAIDLPAGGTAALAPGNNHVMLIGLRQALKQGDSLPLTLTFEKAGAITIDVAVRAASGRSGHTH